MPEGVAAYAGPAQVTVVWSDAGDADRFRVWDADSGDMVAETDRESVTVSASPGQTVAATVSAVIADADADDADDDGLRVSAQSDEAEETALAAEDGAVAIDHFDRPDQPTLGETGGDPDTGEGADVSWEQIAGRVAVDGDRERAVFAELDDSGPWLEVGAVVDAGASDVEVAYDVSSTDTRRAVLLRVQDRDNYLFVQTNLSRIYKVVDGSRNRLDSGSNLERGRITVDGDQIRVFDRDDPDSANPETEATVPPELLTGTRHGIGNGSRARTHTSRGFNDFSVAPID